MRHMCASVRWADRLLQILALSLKRVGFAALESDNPELHAAFARYFQLREELQGEEAWEQ